MTRLVLCVCVLLGLVSVVCGAPAGDLISNLPGFGAPPTAQYSGFIPADSANSTLLHYWFVESSGNPKTDPVVLWLNGGPGCSSLEGYLFELGPLHFTGNTDNVTGIPTLMTNPQAWTSIANFIFLESPAGVGFSYNVNGSLDASDDITSQNNYGFLLNFFAAFPEYANNDFYITGESYAGIYIPTLVDRIRTGINKLKLKGFAVGNGCWGNAVGTCAFADEAENIDIEFLYGHAMVSQPDYLSILANCGGVVNSSNPAPACQNAFNNADNDSGDFNIYDIYDPCPALSSAKPRASFAQSRIGGGGKRRAMSMLQQCISPDDFGTNWLDTPSVRQALHVTASPLSSWGVCASLNYNRNVDNLLPIYPTLAAAYRTLIYSGDVDGCVPHVGTEAWTRQVGGTPSQPWQPWLLNDQVAGYVTVYPNNGFTFLTVKGAGHMVPQYQPDQAFAMFQRFLTNTPY